MFISFLLDLTGRSRQAAALNPDTLNPVDKLDQKSSGGVYPRLNGG